MIQLSLMRGEFANVDLCVDDTTSFLPVTVAGGKIELVIQTTTDRATWASPITHARLCNESRVLTFKFPAQTRALRVSLENRSDAPSFVTLGDEPVSEQNK